MSNQSVNRNQYFIHSVQFYSHLESTADLDLDDCGMRTHPSW